MPNHVTQKLTIRCNEPAKVLDHIRGSARAFDFNQVIPMPPELDIESSTKGKLGMAAITDKCEKFLSYKWVQELGIQTSEEFSAYVEKERPEAIDLGRRYLENQQRFGHFSWYQWRVCNWGTKWNAYRVSEPEIHERNAVVFYDTAWSCPTPVIAKLSEQFPSSEFTLSYFEELWSFAGTDHFRAGQRVAHCFEPAEHDPITQETFQKVYGVELESMLTRER